jgi:hypothetical protein
MRAVVRSHVLRVAFAVATLASSALVLEAGKRWC